MGGVGFCSRKLMVNLSKFRLVVSNTPTCLTYIPGMANKSIARNIWGEIPFIINFEAIVEEKTFKQ